jgi:hypothetical protein
MMARKGNKWTQEDIDKLPPGMVKDAGTTSKKKPVASSSLERMQALGRLKDGEMNKTERHYSEHLEQRKRLGEILWYQFEPMNLKLAPKCFYKVDYLVMTASGHLEVHEVKGYWTDDALVKIKVAAEKFPFRFIAVRLVKGGWEVREF